MSDKLALTICVAVAYAILRLPGHVREFLEDWKAWRSVRRAADASEKDLAQEHNKPIRTS
jgi:hypothetical protein